MAVVAVVAAEGVAEGAQGFEERGEEAAAVGQGVLDVRGAAAEVAALDEAVVLHVAEAVHEGAAADGLELG